MIFTAWKVSVFGVILLRIFPHSDWILNTERYEVSLRIQSECRKMRTRITPNMDTFYAVITIAYREHPNLLFLWRSRVFFHLFPHLHPYPFFALFPWLMVWLCQIKCVNLLTHYINNFFKIPPLHFPILPPPRFLWEKFEPPPPLFGRIKKTPTPNEVGIFQLCIYNGFE